MRLAIVGTRNPSISYSEWVDTYKSIIDLYNPTCIVSGGAKGIDTYAKLFSQNSKVEYLEFLPNYSKYGRIATFLRNKEIVDNADAVLAFVSPSSKGTWDTINKAKSKGIKIQIINIL